MTEPTDDLLVLATPYALHAMTEAELADVDQRIATAPAGTAQAFADEVRAVREAMAIMSTATAVEPPLALRDRLLTEIAASPAPARVHDLRPRRRWTNVLVAAAAAVVIGLGALGVGLALRPPAPASTAEQVFAAPDVRTISGDIPGGGTATVVFSRMRNAGVLVMNNVTPPKADSVYQMWLVGDSGPHSAGTMDAQAVAPSTTAVLPDIGNSTTLAFTIEPPGGSQMPTSTPFASLPLV